MAKDTQPPVDDWQKQWIKGRVQATPAQIAKARELYVEPTRHGDQDFDIDEDALASHTDGDAGTWVQGWFWVSDADMETAADE